MKKFQAHDRAKVLAHLEAGRKPLRIKDGIIPEEARRRLPGPGDFVVLRGPRDARAILAVKP